MGENYIIVQIMELTQFRIVDIELMEDKYKHAMLQSLGHGLKTPLNSMIGNLENALSIPMNAQRNQLENVISTMQTTIQNSLNSAIYLLELIESFNDYMQAETGTYTVTR